MHDAVQAALPADAGEELLDEAYLDYLMEAVRGVMESVKPHKADLLKGGFMDAVAPLLEAFLEQDKVCVCAHVCMCLRRGGMIVGAELNMCVAKGLYGHADIAQSIHSRPCQHKGITETCVAFALEQSTCAVSHPACRTSLVVCQGVTMACAQVIRDLAGMSTVCACNPSTMPIPTFRSCTLVCIIFLKLQQVEAFCTTLVDSLADKRKGSAHEGDGNDYIVMVDGIIYTDTRAHTRSYAQSCTHTNTYTIPHPNTPAG